MLPPNHWMDRRFEGGFKIALGGESARAFGNANGGWTPGLTVAEGAYSIRDGPRSLDSVADALAHARKATLVASDFAGMLQPSTHVFIRHQLVGSSFSAIESQRVLEILKLPQHTAVLVHIQQDRFSPATRPNYKLRSSSHT